MATRYDILEQLGEGGAGAVFKAWDKRLQRYVAIKRLHPPETREGDGVGTDLVKEAAALSSLQHPNIVSVYDLDELDGEPCVVMEFLNGETLEQTMRRGALTVVDFVSVARQTLEGLVAAHRLGVQHRDIKPSNLMVNWLPNGDFLVKVLDFGLADFSSRPHVEAGDGSDSAYGSVHFMAPEQFLRRPVDVRTDIYSAGCVLYYALTAAFPYDGRKMEEIIDGHLKKVATPVHRLRGDVPQIYGEWVAWLMSREPEARPQSAEEALDSLRQIEAGTLKSIVRKSQMKTTSVKPVVPASKTGPTPNYPAQGPKPPAPRKPVPGAFTAQASSANEVPISVAAPKKSNSKLVLIGAIAAVAIGLVVIVLLVIQKKQGPVVVADVGKPPAVDPVVWVQANLGTKTNKGAQLARLGEKVDLWEDQSDFSGRNDLHYIATRSNSAERLGRLPVLVEVNSDGVSRRALRFTGESCLLIATEDTIKSDVVRSNSEENSAPELTYIFALQKLPDAERSILMGVGGASGKELWECYLENGQAHMRNSAKPDALTSVNLPASGDAFSVMLTISSPRKEAQIFVTGADGTTVASPIAKDLATEPVVKRVRVGAPSIAVAGTDKTKPVPRLRGDIIEILTYNRILTKEERGAYGTYFRQKYGR